jgi:hypothetical protein
MIWLVCERRLKTRPGFIPPPLRAQHDSTRKHLPTTREPREIAIRLRRTFVHPLLKNRFARFEFRKKRQSIPLYPVKNICRLLWDGFEFPPDILSLGAQVPEPLTSPAIVLVVMPSDVVRLNARARARNPISLRNGRMLACSSSIACTGLDFSLGKVVSSNPQRNL